MQPFIAHLFFVFFFGSKVPSVRECEYPKHDTNSSPTTPTLDILFVTTARRIAQVRAIQILQMRTLH